LNIRDIGIPGLLNSYSVPESNQKGKESKDKWEQQNTGTHIKGMTDGDKRYESLE
jgi:hypothetical protein